MAALLYKVEAFVRLGLTKQECTDVACKWNNDFVKKVTPEPISKIKFYKDTCVQKAKKSIRKQPKSYSRPTHDEQQTFLKSLTECDSIPVVLSCFNGYSEKFHWNRDSRPKIQLPQPLRELYFADNDLSEDKVLQKCEEIFANMRVTTEEVSEIEKCTLEQSDCLAWYDQRCGRITSSSVHGVLQTDPDKPSNSVIKQICFPEKVSTTAINWGQRHEKTALQSYAQLLNAAQPPHTGLSVQRTGLRIAEEKPFLGASADLITQCECHGKRVVEVKCPYSFRNKTVQDFFSDKQCYIEGMTLKKRA